jgi:hypothetical protein
MASLADALEYQQKRQQMLNSLNDQPTDLEKAVQDQFGMQPNVDRAALLPYKSKDKGWVAPEAVYQLAKLLASPATALKGGNISNQEAIEAGNTLSGFMTPAGLASKIEPGMANMNVYHGTPHTFDAFDASKIGTGEGAQAYGHGIYVAESPKTAETYKRDLAGEFSVNGNTIWKNNKKVGTTGDSTLDDLLMANHGHIDPAIELAKNGLDEWIPKLEALRGKVQQSNQGHLLTVDLPDSHIDRMLDWDKPLSEQHPDVQKAIKSSDFYKEAKSYYKSTGGKWYLNPDEKTGQSLYQYLQSGIGDTPEKSMPPADASNYLKSIGIPGIKYLDAGSREAGEGTRNFVVFPGEEQNLTILQRKAEGGLIDSSEQTVYNPERVQSIVDQLHQDMYNE